MSILRRAGTFAVAFAQAYAKAITSMIVSGLTLAFGHYGLHLDPAWLLTLTVVLSGLLVFRVPNKPAQ